MLAKAFGIVSLVFAIVAIFIPLFGVFVAGLSGILAWLAVGRAVYFGLAAVIINLINIILFSPAFLAVSVFAYQHEQAPENIMFKAWTVVLLIQIIAPILYVMNFFIDIVLKRKRERKKEIGSKRVAGLNGIDVEKEIGNSKTSGSSYTKSDSPLRLTKVSAKKKNKGSNESGAFWQSESTRKDVHDIDFDGAKPHVEYVPVARVWQRFVYGGALVVFVLVSAIILKPDLFPSFTYSGISSSISRIFPDKTEPELDSPEIVRQQNAPQEKNIDPVEPDLEETLPPHYSVTPEMLEEAFGEVLAEKQNKVKNDQLPEQSIPGQERKHHYVIVLAMGREIITDNLRYSADKVFYKDPKGYEIAIDRFEITKVIKRY